MMYTFRVKESKYSKVKQLIFALSHAINRFRAASDKDYNDMLASILAVIQNYNILKNTPLFVKEFASINASKPLTQKTVWGGVVLKKVDVAKNYIRKLLVIRQFGILGFEIHTHKLEKLKVIEGECLFIYSNHNTPGWEQGDVSIVYARSGDRLTLLPGDEHGIIALSDCVIEETSTNHLDDLTYIFNSQQVI